MFVSLFFRAVGVLRTHTRVCVCVCVRARARMCVRVCVLISKRHKSVLWNVKTSFSPLLQIDVHPLISVVDVMCISCCTDVSPIGLIVMRRKSRQMTLTDVGRTCF